MQKWEYLFIEVSLQQVQDEGPTRAQKALPIWDLYSNGTEVFGFWDLRFGEESQKLPDYLNRLGAEGWELVTTFRRDDIDWHREFMFKRPIE